jgi:hypothetical protein
MGAAQAIEAAANALRGGHDATVAIIRARRALAAAPRAAETLSTWGSPP